MEWELQAIVRGCSTTDIEASIDSVMGMDNPQFYYDNNNNSTSLSQQQDVFFKFSDVSETTMILDELEQLYKPFYPQTILTSSTTSISVPTEVMMINNRKPKIKKLRKQQQQPNKLSDPNSDIHPAAQLPIERKGKNQEKRLVQKLTTADGVACDKWAWRKYGQKPIKGSPYPRSYYRCSSSKGCSARKQVERSSTNPGVFIITYSGEHNHSHPTRRSSLAGSTRNKASISSSTPPGPTKINKLPLRDHHDEIVTSSLPQENIKNEEEENVSHEENKRIDTPDLIFSDDLFPSLEDLEGLLLDQFTDHDYTYNFYNNNSNWYTNESVTLNGGAHIMYSTRGGL